MVNVMLLFVSINYYWTQFINACTTNYRLKRQYLKKIPLTSCYVIGETGMRNNRGGCGKTKQLLKSAAARLEASIRLDCLLTDFDQGLIHTTLVQLLEG